VSPHRRRRVLLAVVVVAAAFLGLPQAMGTWYAARQMACFDTLLSRRAPLEEFDRHFGHPTFQYTLPSGDVTYGYRLSHRLSVAVAVRHRQVEEHGKDIPDSSSFEGDVVTRYADTWRALRHPSRFASSCR
jgi:hypothetical protein